MGDGGSESYRNVVDRNPIETVDRAEIHEVDGIARADPVEVEQKIGASSHGHDGWVGGDQSQGVGQAGWAVDRTNRASGALHGMQQGLIHLVIVADGSSQAVIIANFAVLAFVLRFPRCLAVPIGLDNISGQRPGRPRLRDPANDTGDVTVIDSSFRSAADSVEMILESQDWRTIDLTIAGG